MKLTYDLSKIQKDKMLPTDSKLQSDEAYGPYLRGKENMERIREIFDRSDMYYIDNYQSSSQFVQISSYKGSRVLIHFTGPSLEAMCIESLGNNNVEITKNNKILELFPHVEYFESRGPLFYLPKNLVNLKFASIRNGSFIKEIPKELTNLTRMSIGYANLLHSIPETLVNLKYLEISNCPIERIPKELTNLEQLKMFSCTNIRKIPELKNLRNLSMVQCFIKKIENQYPNLETINILNLSGPKKKMMRLTDIQINKDCVKCHFDSCKNKSHTPQKFKRIMIFKRMNYNMKNYMMRF